MTCLFCDNGQSFTTKEHIIPESLGNNDFILEKEICDKCQNYLSQIENYVLNRTPIGFWRVLFTIKTKKNKLPQVDFYKKNEQRGVFPDFSQYHDNFQLQSHSDFTTELIRLGSIDQRLSNDDNYKLKYVITPKSIHEIGRFLGKIGIEVICHNDRERARFDEFQPIRKYVREGSLKELWPIFHTTEGDIRTLIKYVETEEHLEKIAECYSYSISQVGYYTIFNLKIGVDSWFICLNQQFPHPDIIRFMGDNVNAIWYSREQWKK
jgi:hypothetical protein